MLKLFVNDHAPAPGDKWWDYVEPSGGWYSPQQLSDLTDPRLNGDGLAQSQSGDHDFVYDGSYPPVTIRGAWLTDRAGMFLAAALAGAPLVLAGPGDVARVQAVFTF